MLYSPNNKSAEDLNLEVDGIKLPFVNETKVFGVWIDTKLCWSAHYEKICAKIRKGIGLLSRGKNLLTTYTKRILYFAQIHSHISYCFNVWGNMISGTHLKKLQKLQNKCVTLLSGKMPINSTYKTLGILPLTLLLKLENAKMGYKLVNDMLPVRIKELCFTNAEGEDLSRSHQYNTSKKHLPNNPKATNSKYKNSIIYKGPYEFSALKAETRNKQSLHLFQASLKKELLNSM